MEYLMDALGSNPVLSSDLMLLSDELRFSFRFWEGIEMLACLWAQIADTLPLETFVFSNIATAEDDVWSL